jgi:aromatic-L-amino-acid decarboxylase
MSDELRENIASLERQSLVLEPDSSQRNELSQAVQSFAENFLESLEEGNAYQTFDSVKGYFKLNDSPVSTEDMLDELRKGMLDHGLNPASGGHLGYIPGGGLFASACGDFLAAITNQYAGISYGGPGAVRIENELIRWLCDLMSYPSTAHGNLTSGGSIANLIAIVTARESKAIKSSQISETCIYLSSQVHHCVHKAIRIAGLAEAGLRIVPLDGHFRMDAGALEEMLHHDITSGLRPFLVVASAGTTDTGAIDPLDRIADLAGEHGLWFHVDAAYGGFFRHSHLSHPDFGKVSAAFAGIERSDSVVVDPHKGLFLPYGLGAVLIKDMASMYRAHYYRAAYMQDSLGVTEEWSPADLSPELTKHFRGLRLWLPLKMYGFEPFLAALDEKLLLCRYFYHEVRNLGFETGPFPDLSVCIYRYVPADRDANAFNELLVREIVKHGRVFVSSTTIDEIFWIRIAILSFRTHIRLIDEYLFLLKDYVHRLLA